MFFSARNCRMLRRCELVHCRGEAATICPATTLVSSRALSEANAAGSLCRLADWSSGPVARTHCLTSKNVINMTLTFDFDCLAFFGLVDIGDFHSVTSLALGFLVILKNPWLYEASLVQFEDARWWPDTPVHAALLLIIIQQPWRHFCADFPHERCKLKHVKQNSVVAES